MSAATLLVRPVELRPGDVLTAYGEPRTVTFPPTVFWRERDGRLRLRVITTAGIVTWSMWAAELEIAEVRDPRRPLSGAYARLEHNETAAAFAELDRNAERAKRLAGFEGASR